MSLFAAIGFTAAAASIATTTLAVGSVVLSAGMAGLSAAQQADAQKQSNNYNAAVARNNATIASEQRSVAIQKGINDAQQSQLRTAHIHGSQTANLAANGVDITQGSAKDILDATNILGAQDVASIQNNAARTAWGYDIQASNETGQSNLLKWQSDNTSPSKIGAMSGTSSLLSSAGSYAMMKAAR